MPGPPARPSSLPGPRAAWSLVAGSEESVKAHSGTHIGRLWLWLGLAGLAWGLAAGGVWAAAANLVPWWRTPGSLPMMPVAALVAFWSLSPLRRTLAAPAELLRGESPAGRTTFVAGTVVVLTLGLLWILPYYRDGIDLPYWLAWLRPMAEYRVLVLMPVWGAWAMMVPLHFSRPTEHSAALLRAAANRQPVAATAFWMAAALAGTLWGLNFLGAWAALPAAFALVAGSVGGVAICRAAGGLSIEALRAANLAAQAAVLVGYLIGKTHA